MGYIECTIFHALYTKWCSPYRCRCGCRYRIFHLLKTCLRIKTAFGSLQGCRYTGGPQGALVSCWPRPLVQQHINRKFSRIQLLMLRSSCEETSAGQWSSEGTMRCCLERSTEQMLLIKQPQRLWTWHLIIFHLITCSIFGRNAPSSASQCQVVFYNNLRWLCDTR